MSATRNTEAAANSQGANDGEFHSSIERSEPMTTHGHQPGRLTSEADQAPEFHAEVLPAGSAPAESTFKPNNISDVTPVTSKPDPDAQTTSASDTIGGASSADVHTGLGHPGQGQTSNELRGHGAKQTGGLEGVGASGVKSANLVDAHQPEHAGQRALDKEEAKSGRGNVGGPPAQDRVPETAEGVASEAPRSS